MLQTRRKWNAISKSINKEKTSMNTILTKLSFRNAGERNNFLNKNWEVHHYICLQEMLRGVLQVETKGC